MKKASLSSTATRSAERRFPECSVVVVHSLNSEFKNAPTLCLSKNPNVFHCKISGKSIAKLHQKTRLESRQDDKFVLRAFSGYSLCETSFKINLDYHWPNLGTKRLPSKNDLT